MCFEHGENAPAMSKDMYIDLQERQKHIMREGVAIVETIREKADECHNNGDRTFEDWERMSKWLLGIADRLEYGLGFRRNFRITENKGGTMTSVEIRRIEVRRNEAAAAIDECELAEAHRDEESSSSTYDNIVKIIEKNRDNIRDMGWCVRRY